MNKKTYQVQRAHQADERLPCQRSPRLSAVFEGGHLQPDLATRTALYRPLGFYIDEDSSRMPETRTVASNHTVRGPITRASSMAVGQGQTANRSGSVAANARRVRFADSLSAEADDEDVNAMAALAVEGVHHGQTRREVTSGSAAGLTGRGAQDSLQVLVDSSNIVSL
eukprot:gnl/TRDRNA2_/TRDRNA2_43391_c0_seq1.p1 gnl/TRDRNA2_/TRDRNA2_43391_c0~~gnl/TRDRNA2_/TRDRNA2_43391_c0_seq1.p1  ORF type:complete len:168 (-),score=17.62 gnl/TRDRNA2_/TRDRNA2_43391_c0_seq1:34-537(-)